MEPLSEDVTSEISPDDFMADEQPKVDPSPTPVPKADEKPEVEPPKEEPKPDGAEADKPKLEDEVKPAEQPKDEPKAPETKADQRKEQLNTEIRDLVSQRNTLREQVQKANAEAYQPATELELSDETNPETGEPYTKVEAKLEAFRQEREVEKFNERVAEAQLTIGHESQRVLSDFPIFNPESKEFDQELAEEAAGLLQANLIIDPNTEQVIGSNVSPYQLYKTLARASGISATRGRQQGQQDAETMLANADNAPSTSPPKEKVDPLIELWKEDD